MKKDVLANVFPVLYGDIKGNNLISHSCVGSFLSEDLNVFLRCDITEIMKKQEKELKFPSHSSRMVTKSVLKMCTPSELFNAARENIQYRLISNPNDINQPVGIHSTDAFYLKQMIGIKDRLLVTTSDRRFGSGALFVPACRDELMIIASAWYVMPLSIHGVVVEPCYDKGYGMKKRADEMISEIIDVKSSTKEGMHFKDTASRHVFLMDKYNFFEIM